MNAVENIASVQARAPSMDELGAELERTSTALGFRYFSYLAPSAKSENLTSTVRPNFITNYPAEWRTRYLGRGYHRVDPVVLEGRWTPRPYFWGGELYLRRFSKEQRRFFGEARSFGIASGMSIAVHGPQGESTILTFASDSADSEFRNLAREAMQSAQLLAMHAHAVAVECWVGDETVQPLLSRRQQECLLWTAQGKTSWEIAQIIGRSTATVNYHLQGATRKLQASNKVHAAFVALERGLLR